MLEIAKSHEDVDAQTLTQPEPFFLRPVTVFFSYDAMGRRQTVDDQSERTFWEYDSAGRLKRTGSGRPWYRELAMSYDAESRRRSLELRVLNSGAGSSGSDLVTYAYDPVGRLQQLWENGVTP